MLFPFKLDSVLSEQNGEAVCMVEELPFSQDTIDLTFGKSLFFVMLKNSVLRFVFDDFFFLFHFYSVRKVQIVH